MVDNRHALYRLSPEDRSQVIDTLSNLLSQEPTIAFAYLYGSFLDGAFHDIDIAMYVCRNEEDDGRIYVPALTERLGGHLSFPIDVRIVNDAPVSFLYHVLRGHPLFIKDDGLLTDLMENVARRYHDIAPLLRQSTREAFTE